MKGWNSLIAISVIAMLVVSILPVVSGVSDSLQVVMTIEDKEYSAGDIVKVDLWIYQKGVLTDIDTSANDTLNITVSTHYNMNNADVLDITYVSVGRYSAEYEVGDNDHALYFYYNVIIGTDNEDNDHDIIRINIMNYQDSVEISFDGQNSINAHPGDTVKATIEVYSSTVHATALLDVNDFDHLYVEDPDGDITNFTDYNRVEVGVYEVDYTLPDTDKSGRYELFVELETGQHASAYINLKVLDVWFRQTKVAGNTVSFDIGVADLEGLAVEGATVAIVRGGEVDDIGMTGEDGIAELSLVDVWGDQYVEGYVVHGLFNQSIFGTVYNEEMDEPSRDGFDAIYDDEESTYDLSETISRQYTAYYDAYPLESREIYYVITATAVNSGLVGPDHVDAPYTVVDAGVKETDDNGVFTLDLTAPSIQCVLDFYFESAFVIDIQGAQSNNDPYDLDNNRVYEEWPDYGRNDGQSAYVLAADQMANENIDVQASDLIPGEEVTVTVDMPADYNDAVIAMLFVGEIDLDAEDIGEDESVWQSWVGGQQIHLVKASDGTYTGTFMLPSFIDTSEVTVIAGYTDGDTGVSSYNSDIAGPQDDSLPIMWILIVVAIIAVAGIGIVWYFKNN